jgi:hypothetical protein
METSRRRGKPRVEQASDVVKEAVEVQLYGDVLGLSDMDGFPDIKDESPRNQAIMCALACGYSTGYVAKMFKMAQSVVYRIAQRIDPKGMYRLSPHAKRAFVVKLAESRCVEALSAITADKLKESSARELATIAKDLGGMAGGMSASRHGSGVGGRLGGLLEMLEADRVVEGEFEEVGGSDGDG